MIEIFCQTDLDKFKERSTHPKVFSEMLQSRFDELKATMGEFFEGPGEFDLHEFGHIVILERSDDLRDLSHVGLTENGLWGDIPEDVALIEAPGFSVYTIQTAYNNDFMKQFYLPKDEFEDIYPEFQEYMKRWQPEVQIFKPNGEWKKKNGKWLFNSPRYKTQGVDLHVPEKIQTAIWDYISSRKDSGEVPLDYLQVFNLRSEKVGVVTMQIIECIQEVPPYKHLISFPTQTPINSKLFMIDDIDHITLLLATEY